MRQGDYMKNLKIYFTSDMHGFVYPTDYTDNLEKPMGILNIINSFEKDGNTIIIDGGDTIQGSPFTTYLSKNKFTEHPIAKVMNEGGYDFITLGNHDFNYGYDYLKKYLDEFNGKCICCNVKDKNNEISILPYAIKELDNNLKVGIIGFTTDFINIWEHPYNIENFQIQSTLLSLQKQYNSIKDKVDVLIGIYHGGFERDLETYKLLSKTNENLACKICERFDFDILLTGHQHMRIAGQKLYNTYIVQTPANGKSFIELNLKYENEIVEIKSSLKEPKINPNKKIFNELMPMEEKVQKWLDSAVGHLDIDLVPKSHLEMALNGSVLANFINSIQIEKSGADISCTSFANSIKGFNKDVTIRDIVSTYVYPNTLVVLEITGEILKKALLRASEYFNYDGKEIFISDKFLKPKLEHYNYDYFSNIDYGFKLNDNNKNTLEYIKFNNKEVKDDDKLTLVMNNYRASGAGGYEFLKKCKVIKEIQMEMAEIIMEYFRRHKDIVVDKKKYIKIKIVK